MHLYLVRHGQTTANTNGILQGQMDTELTALGQEQAKKIAQRLKGKHFDIIYTSDLKRAKNTAKEIHKFHPNTPLEITAQLRERHYGDFQGKVKKDIPWNHMSLECLKQSILNGESFQHYIKGIEDFLNKLSSKHPNQHVLCVSHNGILKAMYSLATGNTLDNMPNLKNTGLTHLEFTEHELKTHIHDCIKHLEE